MDQYDRPVEGKTGVTDPQNWATGTIAGTTGAVIQKGTDLAADSESVTGKLYGG
jgi:hypothetical protein